MPGREPRSGARVQRSVGRAPGYWPIRYFRGVSDALRESRVAAGLSQAALAAAAGHQPSGRRSDRGRAPPAERGRGARARHGGWTFRRGAVRAAAGAWRPSRCSDEAVPDGSGVLAARVGGRLVHAAAGDALAVQGWPRANAVLRDGEPAPLPGADLDGFVLVGCDPALGLAAGDAAGQRPAAGGRVVRLDGGGIGCDGRGPRAWCARPRPRGRLPSAPAGALRLHLARWRVGVASRGRRARPVAELCARGARVVQREEGAASQKAFAAAVAAEGGSRPPVRWPPAISTSRAGSRTARRPA